ncbi:zinc finger protein 561-like [Metopolophium dirhodum]|uniref:zinc finger protein 561-like n=1 Tax=Metopolophium dirhodum TaxID=44670 RepID=UPI00298FED6A|nr:zinc finger protein 561-like [Metopolophium dirhodum]
MKNDDSIEDIEMDQSKSEMEQEYDEWYSCIMCDVSFNSQFALDAHLQTHVDDDTFHHSNIYRITKPLPKSSIKPPKNFRCICQGICKIKLPYNEQVLNHIGEKLHHFRVCDTQQTDEKAEEEESKKYAVQEAIGSSRQDTLNTFEKRKEQPTDYNTEEYTKLLKTLIQEKNSTGQFNEAKFMGPLFWKNSLFKAGLIEEPIHPVKFQGRLRPIECTSCGTFFAKLPISNEVNIMKSKLPCPKCFNTENESTLLEHQLKRHRELPPFICKECMWKSETWFKYIQHMKTHFRCVAKCSECVYSDMMNKPANTFFLCHVCEMSFDSDDERRVHVKIHVEN